MSMTGTAIRKRRCFEGQMHTASRTHTPVCLQTPSATASRAAQRVRISTKPAERPPFALRARHHPKSCADASQRGAGCGVEAGTLTRVTTAAGSGCGDDGGGGAVTTQCENAGERAGTPVERPRVRSTAQVHEASRDDNSSGGDRQLASARGVNSVKGTRTGSGCGTGGGGGLQQQCQQASLP